MSTSRPSPTSAGAFSRALAGFLAGLVLTLALLAVSPDLHEHLHRGEPRHAHAACPDHDEDCVVHLFAHGITMPLALLSVAPPVANWTAIPVIVRPWLYLPSPRYLHQPERGPPLVG